MHTHTGIMRAYHEQGREKFKMFHKIIRNNLSVKKLLIRLRDSEESIADDEIRICEELNNKFKSIFPVEDTLALSSITWSGKEILENIKMSKKDINGTLNVLHPYKAQGPYEISLMC